MMNKKLMTFLAVIGTLICLSINAQPILVGIFI